MSATVISMADFNQTPKHDQENELAAFRANLSIPDDAKAVIIATLVSLDEQASDPQSDYYRTKKDRVIILAWSKHERDLFSELRKAVKNHPDTSFLSDPEQSEEHREKWSMGRGFYMTNKGYIREGWEVRKVRFWGEKTKEKKASQIPMGTISIPNYQPPQK